MQDHEKKADDESTAKFYCRKYGQGPAGVHMLGDLVDEIKRLTTVLQKDLHDRTTNKEDGRRTSGGASNRSELSGSDRSL